MAAITDLTFTQVNTAHGTNIFSYDAGTSDILLSVKALTGNTYTALTNEGITELFHKLLLDCQEAQVTANSASGVLESERLLSFPQRTTGSFNPDTLQVPIRHVVEVALNVDPDLVSGVNV